MMMMMMMMMMMVMMMMVTTTMIEDKETTFLGLFYTVRIEVGLQDQENLSWYPRI